MTYFCNLPDLSSFFKPKKDIITEVAFPTQNTMDI